jgi:predicted Zn-dependent peptidase
MNYTKTLLSNGLRVITIPMPSFESVTVLVMAGAGSRYETKQNNGISHFLEHMAFKGTEKRPSAMDIAALIDGIGGEFNAFTGKESTGYYIKAATNNLEVCIDVLSDMLMHSKLDKDEIEKEKGVIIEEINMYEDTPMRKIGDIYEQLLYGDTPLGWDIAGEKDIIRKITREDFVSYMGSLYSAANMTVVVAGGIDEAKTLDMIKKYFDPMSKFDTITYEPIKEEQTEPQILVRHKATEQIHIALGVRTVDNIHDDRYALSVLASVIGGGMSSRLFSEVREKRGLAYYIRAHSDHYMDCGTLVTMAGVDPKRVDTAIQVIMEQYQTIANGQLNITDEELKKAKEYLKGHLVLELEDSRSVATYYAHQELTETRIDNPDVVLADIDKVTKEHVNEVGKKYFKNEGLNLALIGNYEDSAKDGIIAKEKLEKVLKFS